MTSLSVYHMAEPMRISLDAYQVIEKVVRAGGNSGRVYVPKEWIDKRVKIVLVEPLVSDGCVLQKV